MDPFGFSSFVADLKLDIFLSIFPGVGGDLFPEVDLETTCHCHHYFLMTTHYQHPITFLDYWSWPQKKKEESDANLLMRNALVWF
jgi:hypothetical protein